MQVCHTTFYPVWLSNKLQKHTILLYCKETILCIIRARGKLSWPKQHILQWYYQSIYLHFYITSRACHYKQKKPTIFNMTLDICYHTNLADLVTYELIPDVIEFGNRPESIYTSITTQICSKAARQMKENVK